MTGSQQNETRRGSRKNRSSNTPGRVTKEKSAGRLEKTKPRRKCTIPVSGETMQGRRSKNSKTHGYSIPSLYVEDSLTDEDTLIDVEGDDSTVPLFQLRSLEQTPLTPFGASAFSSSDSSTSSLIRAIIPTPSFRLFTRPLMNRDNLVLRAFGGKPRAPTTAARMNLTNDSLEAAYYRRHRPLELAERRARKREAELDRYMAYISRLRREAPELWSKKSAF